MDDNEKTVKLDDEAIYGHQISLLERILNPSAIFGVFASIMLTLGLLFPIIDFRAFHQNVDIQYNFVKVCKNVGILSSIWNGIPYGIAIGIIMLFVLSFVNIPQLKIIPCVLIILMYVIVLCDAGNVIRWANELLDKFLVNNKINISRESILDGIMYGAYFTAAGILMALISCFSKGAK